MVGREEDARNDGDFFCLDILGESIFIANSDNNISGGLKLQAQHYY